MKKIMSIAAGAFLSLTNLCAQTNNTLVVFTEGGEPFHLILNGLRQNDEAATNVKAINLNQSSYKAKVIFANKSIPDADKTLYMMWEGNAANNMEFVCSLKKDKKGVYKWKLVSTAAISANSPYASVQPSTPSSTSTTTVSSTQPTNSVSNSTTVTTSTTAVPVTTGVNVGVNGTGFNINMTVTDPTMTGGMAQSTTTTTTTTTTTGSNTTVTSSNNPSIGINTTIVGTPATSSNVTYTETSNTSNNATATNASSTSNCAYAMGSTDFATAKKSIESKSFEDSKLTIAKQIFNSNCLNSTQVKELMDLFTYENTKLDWAKFAYKKTVDKNNYFKVNDGFTYETSIDELNTYISSVK